MTKFIKRTSEPAKNDVCYYGNKNSMVNYGYGLPNCTTYVHGRFAELGADESKLCLGDAKYYYDYQDGFERSSEPKVGAIGCYNGGQYGHVLTVEEIYNDGTMLISESDYVQKIVFRTRRIGQKENVYGYKLQGFILCPVKFEEDTPEIKPTEHKYKIGDRVVFSTCYTSSTSPIEEHITADRMARNYGTITRIVEARNPYLLDDGLCWVNDGDIRGFYNVDNSIKVGDKVKVKNAVQYNGQPFAVNFDKYDVIEVNGDRVVIGIGNTVTCAININNIIKA